MEKAQGYGKGEISVPSAQFYGQPKTGLKLMCFNQKQNQKETNFFLKLKLLPEFFCNGVIAKQYWMYISTSFCSSLGNKFNFDKYSEIKPICRGIFMDDIKKLFLPCFFKKL